MKIMNLTPHSITFITENGNMTVEPCGKVARVSVKTEKVGEVDGIAITESVFGEVVDLPSEEEGTVYVVSSLVAQRCRHRADVFIPNESVRDSEGRIIGCKSLGRV